MALVISSQADLNAQLANTSINSSVVIDDLLAAPLDKIITLQWNNLTTINGNLILRLHSIVTLNDAFPNLVSVQNVEINNCRVLNSIPSSAFASLTTFGALRIFLNPNLQSIFSFQNVITLTSLQITGNLRLTDISGFCNLETVQQVLNLENNDSLTNLDPLCHLTNMNNNAQVFLANNIRLFRFCGLAPLAALNFTIPWFIEGNAPGSPVDQTEISQLQECAPVWTFQPQNVVLQCDTTDLPAKADYAKTVIYNDVLVSNPAACRKLIERTWTATGFCGAEIDYVEFITDLRDCPVSFICPADFTATCAIASLCPEVTGQPFVFGATNYSLHWHDFVERRDRKTCKPLVVKRKWSLLTNCPNPNTLQHCVQTITVPPNWPYWTSCFLTATNFCRVL